jgi:Predicted membrane protein
MNTLGNILWVIFGGLFMALGYFLSGLILCITIIGIPFGLQIFKIAGFALLPFGKDVVSGPTQSGCLSIVMNIIWILCGGIELAISHLILGIVFCITIIGIPFGKQHFKLMALALSPFGKEIVYL